MSTDKTAGDDPASKVAESLAAQMPTGFNPQALMADPTAMSAISQLLAKQINSSMMSTEMDLPLPVRRRIKALKRIQLETTQLEAQFYAEVQQLEAKYQKLYQPFYDKRHDIITGSHEPTDEEAHWSEDEDEEDKEDGEKTDDKKEKEASKDDTDPDIEATTGVEDFWLTAFKNCDIFADLIKEQDEPVLQHLTDVKVMYTDDLGLDFSIDYHFSENEWFTNKVLTRKYKVQCEVNKQDPWSFEGATIEESDFSKCKIDWKKGKNLTVKTIKKKQKHKGKGQAKTVTKTVPNETFFNMFSESRAEGGDDEEIAQFLSDDYTRAEFIRDRLVPKAVLFFTGEAVEDDEFGDDDFGSDQDDDSEGGDDYDPQQDLKNAKPPECKTQ